MRMSGSWEILSQADFAVPSEASCIDRPSAALCRRSPGKNWEGTDSLNAAHDVRGLLAVSSCSALTCNLPGFGQFHSAVIPHSDRVVPLINPNLERPIWHSQLPLPPNLWRGQRSKTRSIICDRQHRNCTRQSVTPPPRGAEPQRPTLPPSPKKPRPLLNRQRPPSRQNMGRWPSN